MHLRFLLNGIKTIFESVPKKIPKFRFFFYLIFFFFKKTSHIGAFPNQMWFNSKNSYDRNTCLNLHIS